MEPLPFPARVSVEVTNRCNQACTLCPRDGFTRPLGLLHRERFERVVAEVARHPTVLWLHFLGEPLLHPELAAFVAHAKAAGVDAVGLSTNATLLQGRIVDELLDAGLDRLDCSVDGIDVDSYVALRGVDHFERATANIEAFLARRRERAQASPTVALQFMATPALEAALATVLARWEPLLGEADFIKAIDPAPFGGSVAGATQPDPSADRPPCPWLFGSLMVLQDGTVTMCGADWDAAAPIGHVDRSSLAELWHGPELDRRRRAHLDGRFGDVALCGPCTDWFLADGHGYRNVRPGQQPRPGPVTVMVRRAGEA